MAAEAKFIISAQDKTAAAMQSAKKNFYVGEKAVDAMASKLASLASIGALTVLAAKIAQFSGSCIKEFAAAERAQLRLQAALGNGAGFDKAMNLIDTLGRSYNGSKDDIEGVVSALAALEKSTDQIDAITRASVNLSNTTGQDLNSSYLLLADTFEGKVSAKLKKLIPDLGNLSDAELTAGGAADMINEKLQAITDTIANGTAQQLQNLSENLGDLQENLGDAFAPATNVVVSWLDDVISKMNEAISKANEFRDVQEKLSKGVPLTTSDKIVIVQQKVDAINKANSLNPVAGAINQAINGEAIKNLQKELLTLKQQLANEERIAKWSEDSATSGKAGLVILTKQLEIEKAKFGKAFSIPENTTFDTYDTSKFKLGLSDSYLQNTPQGMAPDFSGGGSKDVGLSNMNPFDGMGKIGDVITSVVGGLDSFIGGIGSVIGSFSMIKQIMDPVGIIIQGIMDVLGPIIEELLTPLIGILRIFGQLIGTFLAPQLRMLTPVIEFITKAFIFLYNYALVPLQNFFIDFIQVLGNFFIKMMNGVISALNRIPFVNIKKLSELDLSGQKAQKISYDNILAAGGGTSGYGSGGSGSGSGGSGSSYTGSKTVTVNIFFDRSYVNGDSREIALMLRQEIRSAEALGY